MIALTSTPSALLYNRIMNAAQKLTCKKLRADDGYQSVLNVQTRRGAPYRAMKNEYIQLLHDASGHWLLTFCSNAFQICDALKTFLNRGNRRCAHALYKNCVKEFIVSFLPVQKQADVYNCGPFAISVTA